jgi:hypothetical protein
MTPLANAPAEPPASIRHGVELAAAAWFDDPKRPRLSEEMLARWDALVDQWVLSSDLPLLIRKARNNRGHLIEHFTGRGIVPTDNSPASWSMALAYADVCPTLAEVQGMFVADQIPIAMVIKREEKLNARYRCVRHTIAGPNSMGWKVAHINDVGLGHTADLESVDLSQLIGHFKRFLSPSNMFLVPKDYAGVAETPEFKAAFCQRAIVETNSATEV